MRTPRAAAKAPSATRPPPAAAARPLTQVDDGQAPVDLTDSLVVGKAETYAGKTTAAKGTSIRPGGPGPIAASNPGDGEASAKRGELDLTRPPRLGEGTSWSCPFPPEADQRGIDEAVVRLALQVDDRGRVTEVMIEQDPGNGFGREAVACARSKTFSPGLDQRGKPVPGRTRVEVRFQR
jgi:protein TonB